MDKNSLSLFLEQKHSKEQILDLTEQAHHGSIQIKDVLDLCFDQKPKVCFRASWLLEYIIDKYPQLLKNYIKRFLESYHLQQNESAQRCFSKIAMIIIKRNDLYGLSPEDYESCLSASFDWLLSEETALAVKCNCIEVIYGLSHHEEWILDELKPILENNLLSDSPALLSRTKRILLQIKKHKNRLSIKHNQT